MPQWGEDSKRGAKRESTSNERNGGPGVVEVAERGSERTPPARGSSESERVRGRSQSEPPRDREPSVADVYAGYQERLQKAAGRERDLEEVLRVEEAKLLALAKERRNRQLQHSINNTKKRVLELQQQLETRGPKPQSASSGQRRSKDSKREQCRVERRVDVKEREESEEDSWERGDGDPILPKRCRVEASDAREVFPQWMRREVKEEEDYWEDWAVEWAREESMKEEERKKREEKEEKERADPLWFAKQMVMLQEKCMHCRRSQGGKWRAKCWKHD